MTGRFIASAILATLCLNGLVEPVFSQAEPTKMVPPPQVIPTLPPTVPNASIPANQPPDSHLDLLAWDAVQKDQTTELGQLTADFIFKVSNPSETPVEITDVLTSCGCTVAKLPSKPWLLVPHTNGEIAVSVNLAGKVGVFTKTITVLSSNDKKILIVQVHMPTATTPDMVRLQNQQLALTDPQRIFKGDCAECHVKPAVGLMGKALYIKACAICHEASPRATMVTDLHNLTHPADFAYWKTVIANGKPPTSMAAFSIEHGGFLTDEQIDSLAKTLTQSFPYRGAVAQAPAASGNPATQVQMIGTPPPANN